jgi:hypothetical protein
MACRDIDIVRRVFGADSVKISEANFEEKVVVELTLQLTDELLVIRLKCGEMWNLPVFVLAGQLSKMDSLEQDRNTMIAWSLPPRDPHVSEPLRLSCPTRTG